MPTSTQLNSAVVLPDTIVEVEVMKPALKASCVAMGAIQLLM